jgi:UDP-N-acetylmuramoylalanine--D-glutamate ligase
VYVKENTFFVQDTVICGTDALQIPGVFNQENACAAISAALAAGAKIEFVEAGLRSFNGLPHRLKFVREVDGVRYFDDSIATTPGSATAALGALPGAKVIILGGSDKGGDYHDVVEACKRANASVIAIGQTGERIAALCQELGVDVVRETGGMRAVVKAAKVVAEQGGTVILSPASASFDQYKSYSDRGDQFVAAVEELS